MGSSELSWNAHCRLSWSPDCCHFSHATRTRGATVWGWPQPTKHQLTKRRDTRKHSRTLCEGLRSLGALANARERLGTLPDACERCARISCQFPNPQTPNPLKREPFCCAFGNKQGPSWISHSGVSELLGSTMPGPDVPCQQRLAVFFAEISNEVSHVHSNGTGL